MATYYVSTDGSDSNDGTSIGTAKATVAAGVALLAAGDTLEILPGVYEIDTTIVITVPGVTIRGYQGVKPTLHRLNNTVSGILRFASTALDCTVEHVEISVDWRKTGQGNCNAIYVENFPYPGGYLQVLNCRIFNASHSTITGNQYCYLVVKGCEIEDSAFNNAIQSGYLGGLYIEGNYYHSSNAQFANAANNSHRGNAIIGNIVTSGLYFAVSVAAGTTVKNNTFVGLVNDGIQITNSEVNTKQATIENNLIVNCGRYGINTMWTGGPVRTPMIGRNAFYNNTSGNYNGVLPGDGDIVLTADPFVDAANGDYSLTPVAQKLLAYDETWPGLLNTPSSRQTIGAWQPKGSSLPAVISPYLIGSI